MAPPDDLKTRPGELKAWLEAFPAAGAFDHARALVDYLAGVNASYAVLDERLGLLELAATRAGPVLDELEGIYATATQPLEAHAREALELARLLAFALGHGYRIGAMRKATEGIGLGDTTRLAPLILRSMRYFGKAMRACYKTYARVPEGAWKEMHQLYLLAEEHGVATAMADVDAAASVTDFYCESLLLSITDPYRLVGGELDAIEALIWELRAPVALGREPPVTRATAHFLVGGSADAPPKPLREAKGGEFGPGARILDASAIVDRLRAIKAPGEARAGLVRKLTSLWDDPPKRAFRRDPAQGSVAICVGVKPIAHFVAHDATSDGEAETKALREGITMPLRALPEDETGQAIPIHEWAVINLSAGGVRVRRSASTAYPITVGEIVGIRAPGKVMWTIGVTRWITAMEEGTTEFGVQFFASAVCAAWVKQAGSSARKLGLLVAEGEENAEESLLTPPGTYADKGDYEISGEGFRSRLRASGLIEGNAHFDLFRVVPA